MTGWKNGMAVLWAALLVGVLSAAAWGQAADPDGPAAVDFAGESVLDLSVDDFKLRINHLTAKELASSAEFFQGELASQVKAIGEKQIEARSLEGEAQAAATEELGKLREERTALVDRFTVVLSDWRIKGGDEAAIAEYDKYISAVSGLVADLAVTDASGLRASLEGWARSPEGGQRWLWNIVKFLGTMIATWIAARVISGMLRRVLEHESMKFNEMLEDFFVNTTRNVVWIIGFVVALSMLEFEIGPFLAAIGVAGFVLGFALQDTLSNFAAGIMLLVYRPYDLGNFVTAGGVTGSVASMNLVSTTMRTPDNQTIVVPNSQIWGGTITNVTGSETRRVDLLFGIAYGDDVDRAREILEEIVEAHELTLKEPEAVVRLHALADSSVNFVVRVWAKTSDYWAVYWDVTREVKLRFDAEGISIPFPQREIHVVKDTPAEVVKGTPAAEE